MSDLQDRKGFKRKTIERLIRFKIKSWLSTIDNEELKSEIRSNYILTGGAITSMLQGYEPNDFDIYFKDVNVGLKVVNHYLSQIANQSDVGTIRIEAKLVDGAIKILVKSAGVVEGENGLQGYKYFEGLSSSELDEFIDKNKLRDKKKKYGVRLISTNAISLNDKLQIVTRFVGPPEEIHKNYDFVHCTNYYTEDTGLVLNQPALESIMMKELKYVGSLYPVASMFRTRKFIRRGWTINAGEMLKIAFDISKLDLENPSILREQLVGVDFAFFLQVLSMLEDKKNIDRTYLFEVLTKVFDENDDMDGEVSSFMTELEDELIKIEKEN